MSFPPLRYEAYDSASKVPNVVVDGSPNESTVLTLTHWPGYPGPAGLADDLSAQMAFRYVCSSEILHGAAEVVTNNHFDQDGLVSVFALSRPSEALACRALMEDVAAAGDFATYRDRRAARLSMVLAAFADPERSPLRPLPADYDEMCALLYTDLSGRLGTLVEELEDHRDLWADEDHQLDESEAALARGDVTIDEHADVDLAVVDVADGIGPLGGHRFAGNRFEGVHPMALHGASDRLAVLVVKGRQYRFTYRYETWVQYQSRRPRPRVDLAPLAAELTAAETDGVTWRADPVGGLTPQLEPVDRAESSLDRNIVVAALRRHLAGSPPAWDPYKPTT